MSNKGLIIPERARKIGDFTVGRILPFRKKRSVGPFVFIDHMGPKQISDGSYMGVDQHPHIGLSTLTYLFHGAVEHKDSSGVHQIIKAGDVGFMTAGAGVTHTERTPEYLKTPQGYLMHGYQIWVALPKEKEEMEPRFDFLSSSDIPFWKEGNIDCRLITGGGFGRSSPLPVHSELFMIEMQASQVSTLNIGKNLKGELGLLIVSGEVSCGNETVEAGNMLVTENAEESSFLISKDSHVLLFGGLPFPEERFIFWNFCSTSKLRLEKAKEDWANKRFPKISGDDTYIPLP